MKAHRIQNVQYSDLILGIGRILISGRKSAYYAVNFTLVKTYWEIGKEIIEYEQKGKVRAEYGSKLLTQLSIDLKIRYGKGFSKSNVYLMRQFYFQYPKFQTVSGKLNWSHYSEILLIESNSAREFYKKQCLNENWSVRELRRQINSALFERIALSKNKKDVLDLSNKGAIIEKAEDLIREPYVLEFLNIPENYKYTEKQLEQKIIDNLQMFFLELGNGFAFVKRQYRITVDNNNYYIDLVFYHRILKCFVLIDLKIGKARHQDIGQMNMYLNYFNAEESGKEDNEPIGIILAGDKNNFLVEYALGGISNKLFVSKYKLYLPKRKELEQKLKTLLSKT